MLAPSDVVAFIDRFFPITSEYQTGQDHTNPPIIMTDNAGNLGALLEILGTIPAELISQSPEDVSLLTTAKNHIQERLQATVMNRNLVLGTIPNTGRQSPVAVIRQIMERLPSAIIPEEISELEFIRDELHRTRLAEDLAEINDNLGNRQWKAATVLGGALLEALLLSTLSEDVKTALSKESTPKREKKVIEDLNEWGLHSCIKVAEEMGFITESTCKLGLLAKDSRNLIHPGRAIRLKLEFNSATAHTVKAALESVICDLQKWYEA